MSRPELAQALQAAIVLRHDEPHARGEIATLEAALEILELEPITCDCKATGERPARGPRAKRHQACACRGVVYMRACADCGHAFTRCEAHGGNKSASREMYLHRQREHASKTETNP